MTDALPADLRDRIIAFVGDHPPASTKREDFLRARYDAGLAWVNYPVGLGGLGLPRPSRTAVDIAFAAAGAPDNNPHGNGIGLGMAAPTILAFGTDEQKQRFLRPLWTAEEIWCQLFSEPGAGSDLAGVSTRADRDEDGWVINGQKVWTSNAHNADWAILLARTDPEAPKHAGLTYFLLPMKADGCRDPPAAADHRRGRVQRGVPHRRPHPGRLPARGRGSRVEGRHDDARQRARLHRSLPPLGRAA